MLLLVAVILLLLVVVVVVGGANWFGGIGTGVLQGKTTVARSGTVNNKLLSHYYTITPCLSSYCCSS